MSDIKAFQVSVTSPDEREQQIYFVGARTSEQAEAILGAEPGLIPFGHIETQYVLTDEERESRHIEEASVELYAAGFLKSSSTPSGVVIMPDATPAGLK